MNTLSFKTHFATKEEAQKEWVVVDATDQVLGRLSAKVAKILRGKYKACFTPNQDCGDNVIIINANKIILTGKKMTDKTYLTYSGYPGGQHSYSPAELIKRHKGYERIVRHAVKGMLPHNTLGSKAITRLKVVKNASEAQKYECHKPQTYNV